MTEVAFQRKYGKSYAAVPGHRMAYVDTGDAAGLPRLFVNTTDGHALIGRNREFCRTWPNQEEVTLPGKHYIQEDVPHELGEAVVRWPARLSP